MGELSKVDLGEAALLTHPSQKPAKDGAPRLNTKD